MLEVKNIYAGYHRSYPVLNDVSFEIKDGDRLAVLGRNGAGKTTLANSLFGLVPYLKGRIAFNGTNIFGLPTESVAALGIGYFMQGAPIFPQLSVRENLFMALGKARRGTLPDVFELFPFLGEHRHLPMPAASLSGGERTQLALAMAVARRPGLLVLDEPFAGLSPANASAILRILDDYQKSNNASLMLIVQEHKRALDFCDSQLLIRDGKTIFEKY
jgi:ABC-type branched-subunit amino acid transport system ATPase component